MAPRPSLALIFGCLLAACDPPAPAEAPSVASTSDASTGSGSLASSSEAVATGAGSSGAASSGSGGDATTSGSGCPTCGQAAPVGNLDAPELDEISGLAASALHPGVYFVHNDSGDLPRFYAIDGVGKRLATYDVDGAFAVDWEDAAAGPCPAGRCLYFADIGDNLAKRTTLTVYRVTEPSAIEPGSHHLASEPLAFSYPDGSHDAETLLVHPTTGELFIVTKVVIGPSSLYRFPMPLTPGATAMLEKIGEVPPPGGLARFTAGSIHPQGKGLLLRAYTALYYYPITSTVAAALAGRPCSVPVAFEKQGETVEWTAKGDGYLTISEGGGAPVNLVGCP
ncbi:MAG: hypothetical protein FJ096_15205 [Deltaproteobacteria bacterium]|nr:hypothetical protein [Deltaproteobacteria bacterium]